MKRMLESCALLVLALAAMKNTAAAQETPGIEGPWQTQVHVFDCDTGVTVRDISALNLFMRDGSITETAVNVMRTSSADLLKHPGPAWQVSFQSNPVQYSARGSTSPKRK